MTAQQPQRRFQGPHHDGWITTSQAAQLLGVGQKTLVRWHTEGRLNGKIRIQSTLGGHRRILESDVLALRATLEQTGEATS